MADLHKKYGSPYYDEETELWNQRYDYVDENGKVWGIGSVDKARSLDLLSSALAEDYPYGKKVGGLLNATTWGMAGAKYGRVPGAILGGLLGAANGYTGTPGIAIDLAIIDGIRALRSLDNFKINGVNINPVEYEDPTAQLRAYERRANLLETPKAKPSYQTFDELKAARHGKAKALDVSLPAGPFDGAITIDNIPNGATYSVGMQNTPKTPATASKTPAAPTTDVITAEDAHLIGFAERHGLGWRDVWEMNKETIPNPNAVQAGTALNLPAKPAARTALFQAPSQARAAAPAQAAPVKRRERPQARFKDYVSSQPQPATKRSNLGMNLLDKPSANVSALRDYGVSLGGWSPATEPRATARQNAQKETSPISGGAELAAIAKRSRQAAAQEARQHQAAVKAEAKANAAFSARLAKEHQAATAALADPQRAARVEKLGESAAQTSQVIDAGDDQSTQAGTANAAASANAAAHARADAANTAKARGAARHDAATNHVNGQEKEKFGKNGNMKDSEGKNVGVGFDRFGRATSVGARSVNANQTNKARNKNGSYSFDADGNGAGDAGGTVICTELYRQGLIDKHVYRADQRFGLRLLRYDPDVITGYHFWATSVVRLMRKSPLFTQIVYKSVGEAWAREMSLREGLNGIGTVRGKLVIAIGIPTCRMIERLLASTRKGLENLA